MPQCFPLLVIGYPFNYRDFSFFLTKYVRNCLLQKGRMRERAIPFPKNCKSAADDFKGIELKTLKYEQYLILPPYFSKDISCKLVKISLHIRKGGLTEYLQVSECLWDV